MLGVHDGVPVADTVAGGGLTPELIGEQLVGAGLKPWGAFPMSDGGGFLEEPPTDVDLVLLGGFLTGSCTGDGGDWRGVDSKPGGGGLVCTPVPARGVEGDWTGVDSKPGGGGLIGNSAPARGVVFGLAVVQTSSTISEGEKPPVV